MKKVHHRDPLFLDIMSPIFTKVALSSNHDGFAEETLSIFLTFSRMACEKRCFSWHSHVQSPTRALAQSTLCLALPLSMGISRSSQGEVDHLKLPQEAYQMPDSIPVCSQ